MDAHAFVRTDLDAILSGAVIESVKKPVEEDVDADVFLDAHAGIKAKLDDVLSGAVTEGKTSETAEEDSEVVRQKGKSVNESYRRVVSRGKTLVDNELFVDFD